MVDVAGRDFMHEQDEFGRRMHRRAGLVAIDENHQSVKAAIELRKLASRDQRLSLSPRPYSATCSTPSTHVPMTSRSGVSATMSARVP